MKATLIITDENGRRFTGEIVLTLEGAQRRSKKPERARPAPRPKSAQLDFDLPDRAFVKQYARGLSGPKKFVLLLAFMTRGSTGKDVQLSEVEKLWNRMTSPSLLGYRFNRFYPITAREHGWVSLKKKGVYTLRNTWPGALSSGE